MFAQKWRDSYKVYVRQIANDPTLPVKTIDEHHYDALKKLLDEQGLEGSWNEQDLQDLTMLWHRLDPWADSEAGIKALNTKFWTSMLSNGNISLLNDLKAHAKLPFTHVCSAAEFGTYKPNPAVYFGAAKKLGLRPEQCVLVAAHLNDLEAAKSCGFQTVYVERSREEDWDDKKVQKTRANRTVDIWVAAENQPTGFLGVAEKLGIASVGGAGRL